MKRLKVYELERYKIMKFLGKDFDSYEDVLGLNLKDICKKWQVC